MPGNGEQAAARLKAQISAEWLGRDGVSRVGVETENGRPIVVIGLIGDDPEVISRLRDRYSGQAVRIRSGEGPITKL